MVGGHSRPFVSSDVEKPATSDAQGASTQPVLGICSADARGLDTNGKGLRLNPTLPSTVIPAKAGSQLPSRPLPKAAGPRLRGRGNAAMPDDGASGFPSSITAVADENKSRI